MNFFILSKRQSSLGSNIPHVSTVRPLLIIGRLQHNAGQISHQGVTVWHCWRSFWKGYPLMVIKFNLKHYLSIINKNVRLLSIIKFILIKADGVEV